MITREEKLLQQIPRAEGIRRFAGRVICMRGFAGDDVVRALLMEKEDTDPRLLQRFSGSFLDHTRRVLAEKPAEKAAEFRENQPAEARDDNPVEAQSTAGSPAAQIREDSPAADDTLTITVSEGGVFAALWRLSLITRCGLTVYLKRIPIHQEVIEICNCLELDPYKIGGCELFLGDSVEIAPAESGDKQSKPEVPAEAGAWQIGFLTDTADKIIRNGEERQFLNRPELPKQQNRR